MPSLTHRLAPVAAAVTAAAALAACGSSSSPAAAPKPPKTVSSTSAATAGAPVSSGKIAIKNFMFMPMAVSVKAGGKLTFTNFDSTAHTASATGGGFDTGPIQPGKSVTLTFKKPGTFAYHCQFHAFMTAHITVVQ